jgi:hypothetical protein
MIKRKAKGEKNIISYNKAFGTSFMNKHIEVEHIKLLFAYLHELERVETTSLGHNQVMMRMLRLWCLLRNAKR